MIFFAIIRLSDASHNAALPDSIDRVHNIMQGLENHFTIGWLSMVPIAVVVPLLIAGLPAYTAIMAGAIAAGLVSIMLQGASIADVTDTLYNGHHIESGVSALDKLLNRGGMSAMYPLAMLFLVAGGLGGALRGCGAINGIIATAIRQLNSRRKIMLSAIAMVFVSLMVGASFSFAALMSTKIMKPLFDTFGIDRQNLSRIIEDIGTVNDPMLPWSAGGIYVSGILGVATLDYIPFMYFSWV